MRLLVGVVIIIVILSMGAAILSVHPTHTQVVPETRGMSYWSGTVSVHITYFKCDPSLDTVGDPDPYFVVFMNEKEIKSQVWDGEHEFNPNWWANFTVTTRDPDVWIEISAWDDDSGLYGRDDLIDISPNDGFSLDLIYNLNTHSWAGDVTGNNASGNRPYDWGIIHFDITSTPDSENGGNINVNLPYSAYDRLDSSHNDGSDTYLFYLYNGDSVNIYMLPNPNADYAIYLYDSDNFLVASSNKGGYGGLEEIHTTINTPGQYKLIVSTVHGYGEYYLSINDGFANVIDAEKVNVYTNEAYFLNADWSNINVRIMGYHVNVTLHNPTNTDGYVRVHFFNLDPDYMITNFENSTERGNYSLTTIIHLNANETKTITLKPWYEPKDDFWIFAMGDNRPGCGVYDHPYEQREEYTLFTHYYTDIIRTPIGWDDGDLVSGFGGGLVAEYGGTSYDALDYVYDMEYNRFYMLTGTHGDFFFTTVGNHDVTRHYDQPQRAGEHIYEEYLGSLYYSFNFSNSHFVFPDDYQDGFWYNGGSWTFGKGETPWWYARDPGSNNSTAHYGGYIYGKQLQWLKNDLANAQGKTHKIVVMHMPIKVPPSRNESLNDSFINYTNRVDVMKIFQQYGVDYLVVAHIHNYTYYYTNLEYVNGKLNVTSSMHPEGEYSVFTLLTGGAGAHNNYEWIVPAIEGSYHFVLIHVQGDTITYHVYKYENLTDSNGNPLTSVVYEGANDGSETSEKAVVHNSAIYSFPYIRMKFYLAPGSNYTAYSDTYGTYQHVYQHKFKDYTVVYVETTAPANGDNTIHVYASSVPELPPSALPLVLILIALVAVAYRKKF